MDYPKYLCFVLLDFLSISTLFKRIVYRNDQNREGYFLPVLFHQRRTRNGPCSLYCLFSSDPCSIHIVGDIRMTLSSLRHPLAYHPLGERMKQRTDLFTAVFSGAQYLWETVALILLCYKAASLPLLQSVLVLGAHEFHYIPPLKILVSLLQAGVRMKIIVW